MTHIPWLSILVFLPLAGALLCLFVGHSAVFCRWLALATSWGVFTLTAGLFAAFRQGGAGWLLYEDHAWIARFGVRYTLGLDGISLLLVLLTGFLMLVAVLVSWRVVRHSGAFFALLLLMEAGILGVFLALDLVLFYLFWELMLIPMLFLIGIWGHERRVYAAVKFFLFTLAGSLLMLLAIIGVHLLHGAAGGTPSFALEALRGTPLPPHLEAWLYAAFLLAFALKVPLLPLHTWLPDAHTEAPTAGSVILAGLLLKTGVYGLIRFGFPLFPNAAAASLPWLALPALAGIFYAAWIAYAQSDAKRLVAYASVAHMGFVVLGLAAWNQTSLEGSILQMVNHGVTTGALFALVGMIDERAHTRRISDLGGLWGRVPRLSFFFLFFSLASLGLPGLNNFVGEILILIGAFQTRPWWGATAFAGVVFAAAYMLRLVQGVLWGPAQGKEFWPDLDLREAVVLTALALCVLWLGLYPAPFLLPLQAPVAELLGQLTPLAASGGAP
ncbi:NADH dehydrogenase [Geoalkalibacter ferrihydriticus DSM 17813]|uniref:NADH dehydrogenase n=1 Tax=Geoalkalibacter ferrihydriticus DSM 17813 TaxID=1121915 RepID=A0A0C2EC90_9BACT|nr:NADH dehydrogenase [Geoalkalibacter ferrihydriticus DSM 17813]